MHDVTVENVYLRGIYASSGGTFSFVDNTIDNVQGDSASIGIFNYTGSGVISGNHVSNANDAIAALTRLLEMGAERPLLAATLIGTVAQRLVRRVCPQCARPMPVPEEARLYLGERAPEVEKRGVGCPYCRGTGYRGRIGVYEVYAPDREALSRFAQGAGEEALRERAQALGHRDLWEVGLLQVRAGMTTTGELLRVLGLWE